MKIMFILSFLFLSLTSFAQQAVVTPDQMDALTPADRTAYYNYLRANVRSCTTAGSTEQSCPPISNISEGDTSFNDPYYNNIPKGIITKPTGLRVKQSVEVITECDPRTKQFFTRVTYLNRNGERVSFQNPLGEQSNVRSRGGQEMWLSSPGKYNAAETNPPSRWRTPLPENATRRGSYLEEWHVVSQSALERWKQETCPDGTPVGSEDCKPPKMPWTTWIDPSPSMQVAYHCSNEVTGYPASHGCIRLKCTNAMALFNLVRRVGTNNVIFNWRGYGVCTGTPDGRGGVLASPSEGTPGQVQERSTGARNNIFKNIGNWFRRTFARPQGQTPQSTPSTR